MRWKNRPEGSNWGDFGPDDQIGRMNLVTPERRLAGVREVVDGISFCLSLPLDHPLTPLMPFRAPPKLFAFTGPDGEADYNRAGVGAEQMGCCDAMCDDGVTLYTQYSTQWDALCHWGRAFDADGDGVDEVVYYNGFRGGEDIIPPGAGGPRANALGIERMAEAAPQGRGVLVNLHRIYGNEHVRVGYDALMKAFEAQRVVVEPGDFLVIYTGLDAIILGTPRGGDPMPIVSSCAGLDGRDERLLQWITDSGVAALCTDTLGVESVGFEPRADRHESWLPLHTHCLFKLGVHLGEMWYLKPLADWLWERDRNAFLLTAPPLRLPGAVGSPVTPIALV
jgi:kynurenine formamidase